MKVVHLCNGILSDKKEWAIERSNNVDELHRLSFIKLSERSQTPKATSVSFHFYNTLENKTMATKNRLVVPRGYRRGKDLT